MRKVIVTNIITLDGYFEGPGNDVMAMPFHEAFDDYNAERLRNAGTLLEGRVTYEGFRDFWPRMADAPEAKPVQREISRMLGDIEKVVVSDSLTQDRTAPWYETRIVKRAAAHETVAELKQGTGGDILTFGSHILWNDLLAHGLVDELHLMLGPRFLCAGTPALESTTPVPLNLVDAAPLPGGSPLILARYTPATAARTIGDALGEPTEK